MAGQLSHSCTECDDDEDSDVSSVLSDNNDDNKLLNIGSMSFHTDRQEASVQRVHTRLENVLKIGVKNAAPSVWKVTRVNLIYGARVLLVTYRPDNNNNILKHSNATAIVIISFINIPITALS
eukprot:5988180-Prymnesium_polylepis.1